MAELTHAQYLAARRDECRMNGHSFSEVVKIGSGAPMLVLCNCCGSSWRIHPDDQERDFPELEKEIAGQTEMGGMA